MLRIIAAFLVAPIPAALIQAVVIMLWPKQGKGVFEHPASMFVAICLIFYVFELIFGLPTYLVLRKRGPQKPMSYGLVGMSMILLPVALALSVTAARGGLSAYALTYNVIYFAVGGFLAGIVFWRIARRQTEASMQR
jgi:hypothetical protein